MIDLDRILYRVEKPSRYTGGEWNACQKPVTPDMTRVAFCFADTYEVGMSHLGLRILYDAVNRMEHAYCERVFAPWLDMEAQLRAANLPLFTLETRMPVGQADIVAFTLQYEMSYTNLLNMLELSRVPLRSTDRLDWNTPLVIAGGPCASNPEPLSPFIDLFLIGDGEESLPNLVALYRKCREDGMTKPEFLRRMADEPGVYVPSLYAVEQDGQGRITAITPKHGARKQVRKCLVQDFESCVYPEKCMVPNMGIIHDRVTLEIMRGCTRGCRFCQAGYIYRPVKERSRTRLEKMATQQIAETGYEEISLSSLSSSDYSEIGQLADDLIAAFHDKRVSVALPSLRLDNFDESIVHSFPSVRKTGLTFAPEAGTQRLRDVINKNVTEEHLRSAVRTAFSLGWTMVKLYFMIGLPTETMEDVEGIVRLAHLVADEYEKINGKKRGLTVTVSTSTFVPKSHTPFQWFGQERMASILEKQDYLKKTLTQRWFKYNWHDPKVSMLEACFARGGRELGDVLEKAFRLGCRFDSWKDSFSFENWQSAFADCGLDPQAVAAKTYADDQILPWNTISYGITQEFLLREKQRAITGQTLEDCRSGCHACGLMKECFPPCE